MTSGVKMDRRLFLKAALYSGTGLGTYGIYRHFRGGNFSSFSQSENFTPSALSEITPETIYAQRNKVLKKSIYNFSEETKLLSKEMTKYESITNYNNFYEFSTNKEDVAEKSSQWKINDWVLEINGLVENPIKLTLNDIRQIQVEERIYRFRCVEGWSMVIPWVGFPLELLLEKVRPLSAAKYVSFQSYYDEDEMPSGKFAGIDLPYVEGLRIDEALHPLTFLATGLYNKSLPNQNGAPIRLVVPWKYGFKSIKSVTKITLTVSQPPTTWNLANSDEYGFYSNVNPNVDHPRWTQKKERRIGELSLRETLMFNGYEKEVAKMYSGMDLKKYL